MLIYMTHPNHGTHIAYSQGEIDDCLKNGWKVREEKPVIERKKPGPKPKGNK
jgi:hypothetical protein